MCFRGPSVSDGFYDEMAENFHLIFDDWNAAIARQREVLAKLLQVPARCRRGKRSVQDCEFIAQVLATSCRLSKPIANENDAPEDLDQCPPRLWSARFRRSRFASAACADYVRYTPRERNWCQLQTNGKLCQEPPSPAQSTPITLCTRAILNHFTGVHCRSAPTVSGPVYAFLTSANAASRSKMPM